MSQELLGTESGNLTERMLPRAASSLDHNDGSSPPQLLVAQLGGDNDSEDDFLGPDELETDL